MSRPSVCPVLTLCSLALVTPACNACTASPAPQPESAQASASGAPSHAGRPAPPPPRLSPFTSAMAPSASGAPEALMTTVIAEGTGPAAKTGDKVSVHYTASLLDGTPFASSRDKNQPLVFTIGERSVVKGMSDGVTGMKVGEKRRLVVPPSLAYGERSNAKIPPNSTLIYEVELLAINPK